MLSFKNPKNWTGQKEIVFAEFCRKGLLNNDKMVPKLGEIKNVVLNNPKESFREYGEQH